MSDAIGMSLTLILEMILFGMANYFTIKYTKGHL